MTNKNYGGIKTVGGGVVSRKKILLSNMSIALSLAFSNDKVREELSSLVTQDEIDAVNETSRPVVGGYINRLCGWARSMQRGEPPMNSAMIDLIAVVTALMVVYKTGARVPTKIRTVFGKVLEWTPAIIDAFETDEELHQEMQDRFDGRFTIVQELDAYALETADNCRINQRRKTFELPAFITEFSENNPYISVGDLESGVSITGMESLHGAVMRFFSVVYELELIVAVISSRLKGLDVVKRWNTYLEDLLEKIVNRKLLFKYIDDDDYFLAQYALSIGHLRSAVDHDGSTVKLERRLSHAGEWARDF